MRTYCYALIVAQRGTDSGDAPIVTTYHAILRAADDNTARRFGRKKFKYSGTPGEGQTVKEIVQFVNSK
jgi:hypothetical protein